MQFALLFYMNMTTLSETNLRIETKQCATREKKETALLIEYLVEIEKRGLHLKWGHGSLFSFLTDELGYERGSAALRASAVRAARVVPDLSQKIESGSLSLKAVRAVESFVYHEGKARGQKISFKEKQDLYATVENLSVSQIESKLAAVSTSPKYLAPKTETNRVAKGGVRVVTFCVTEQEYLELEKAKELLSHVACGATTGEVYKLLVRRFVNSKDPKIKAAKAFSRQVNQNDELNDSTTTSVGQKSSSTDLENKSNQDREQYINAKETRSRYITANEQHSLWASYDNNGCTFADSTTGKRCGSKYLLQKDHRVPFSLGGENKAMNLAILCAAHNRAKSNRI
jgi:hypothetical protein